MNEILNEMRNYAKEIGEINLKLAEDNNNKFYIGKIDITDGVRSKGITMDSPELIRAFDKYISCRWGDGIPKEDVEVNERSMSSGFGDIMGEYMVNGVKIWIKTDLNENTVTTIFLPEEW